MEHPNPSSQPPHHHHHHHHHHCHHHHPHHHHHVVFYCANYNHLAPNPNLNMCPNFINPPPQIPQPPPHAYYRSPFSHLTQTLQDDYVEEFEEEEDEEPIFVMTDEWREFFAKSEAKRKEAKKAKKQGKK